MQLSDLTVKSGLGVRYSISNHKETSCPLFQLQYIALCSDIASTRRSQGHLKEVSQVHVYLSTDILISIKHNLLYYCPAGLSLTWLEQAHWLRLAQTCRHLPSSRPEPQSVTATNPYCSTVCSSVPLSPPLLPSSASHQPSSIPPTTFTAAALQPSTHTYHPVSLMLCPVLQSASTIFYTIHHLPFQQWA